MQTVHRVLACAIAHREQARNAGGIEMVFGVIGNHTAEIGLEAGHAGALSASQLLSARVTSKRPSAADWPIVNRDQTRADDDHAERVVPRRASSARQDGAR